MLVARDTCKRRLAVIWFSGTGVLFVLVLLQTALGGYGDDARDAWGWLLPSIMPTLSLIVGVAVADATGQAVQIRRVDRFVYRLAAGLSAAYLATVLLTIALQPFASAGPLELMAQSEVYLGPFQGLVSASVGVFFIRKEGAE